MSADLPNYLTAEHFTKLNTLHKDLIHDVSFDYYGTMLATCSSDQTIKIWKLNQNDEWVQMQEIKQNDHTHKAAIHMIDWANPMFGSIFASCSTDKQINIFALSEQRTSKTPSAYNFAPKKQTYKFERKFFEFRDAISICFAPSHLGLKLSIVCNDGIIKVIMCRDITNLSQWTQEYSIEIAQSLQHSVSFHTQPQSKTPQQLSLNALSTTAVPSMPMLSRHSSHQRRHHKLSRNMSKSHNASTVASTGSASSSSSSSASKSGSTEPELYKSRSFHLEYSPLLKNMSAADVKSYCMCWNEAKWELPSFAVGANKSRVFIYKYFDKNMEQTSNDDDDAEHDEEDEQKASVLHETKQADPEQIQGSNKKVLFSKQVTLRATTSVSSMKKNVDWHCVSMIQMGKNTDNKFFDVRGISWSHHLGRKYHLIAIGCSDGYVRVLKINRNQHIVDAQQRVIHNQACEWSVIFASRIHRDAVWKVKWNVTGNVLLSAGDDAKIYLWKRNRFNVDQKYVPICISNGKSESSSSSDLQHKAQEKEKSGVHRG